MYRKLTAPEGKIAEKFTAAPFTPNQAVQDAYQALAARRNANRQQQGLREAQTALPDMPSYAGSGTPDSTGLSQLMQKYTAGKAAEQASPQAQGAAGMAGVPFELPNEGSSQPSFAEAVDSTPEDSTAVASQPVDDINYETPPVVYGNKSEYKAAAVAAAKKYGVPPNLFLALVQKESQFNPKAVSPAGARGLTQLMPDTAKGLGVNAQDPMQNLDGGARYLAAQLKTFKSVPLALAAYNAGPGAVQKYKGVPPFKETQGYVQTVMRLAGDTGYAVGGAVDLKSMYRKYKRQKFAGGGLVDNVAKLGRKAQYALSDMVGIGPEVQFATETPAKYFPKSEQHNGRGDAMRHLLFQAQLAQKYGETPAKVISWAHENLSGPQGESEKAMDEYNDKLGREIAKVAKSKDDMTSRTLTEIKEGRARILTSEQMKEGYAEGGVVDKFKHYLEDKIAPVQAAMGLVPPAIQSINEASATVPGKIEQALIDTLPYESQRGVEKTKQAVKDASLAVLHSRYAKPAIDALSYRIPGVIGGSPVDNPMAGSETGNILDAITAFHGSPAKGIRKFDAKFIGSGEGNQSYGHGIYFAEHPDVAKDYRGKLEGSLYKVDIPDEFIPKMLDLSKPIKDQHPEVRQRILASRSLQKKSWSSPLEDKMGYEAYELGHDDVVNAGIPGIKYLDQGSRASGDGTYNYVVFPGYEDKVKVLEENSTPVLPQAQKTYRKGGPVSINKLYRKYKNQRKV